MNKAYVMSVRKMPFLGMVLLFLFMSTSIFAYDSEIDGLRYDWTSTHDSNGRERIKLVGYNRNKIQPNLTIPTTLRWVSNDNRNRTQCVVEEVSSSAFKDCSGLVSVNFGLMTKVNSNTFENCMSLESISLPYVSSINHSAFKGCSSLLEIHVGKDIPPTVYEDSFDEETYKNATLYVPEGTREAYMANSIWNKFAVISDGTTTSKAHTLSIKATGNGTATYNETTIRNETSNFSVNENSTVSITFTPDNGYRIKTVLVNNSTVSLDNNQYIVSGILSNTTVEVEFEAIPVNTYTLSITASGNGSASYDGMTIRGKTTDFTVNEGSSVTISFAPDTGYRIRSVKVGGSNVKLSNDKYTISSITSDTAVEVEFEAITHTLTIKASGNGSASFDNTTIRSKTTTFTVDEGTSATISFTPDTGYKIKSVKVGGSSVTLSNNKYTISSITSDTTVEVEFEAITHTLTIKASGNGTVSYDGTTVRGKTTTFTLNDGSSATITFSPDAGYTIKSVKVGGYSVTLSNNKYTFSSITSDITVEVEFEAITHTLTIKASGNGSASYDNTTVRGKTTNFTVNDGSSATITFSPDAGYKIKSVKVGGSSVTLSNNKYTISSITSDTTVEVEFEAITHTLTIKASGNGSASYDNTTIRSKTTTFTVNDGSSATISFTPDTGYRIKCVKVGGSSVTLSNNKYTISSIPSDTTVEVEFEAITHTLTIKASGNGSASYDNTTIRSKTSTFTVNDGSSATISFTPDTGYRIKSVKVGGSSVTLSNNKYTISSITSDTTIEVEFEATTHTLTIKASGNGSASYDGTTVRGKTSTFTVNDGSSATISFTPDAGYRIKSVKVGGASVTLSNNKYTISNITSDTTVEVEFEAITHTLTIKASGNGSASYDNTTVRGKTTNFTVNDGSSATITFSPDAGYKIKSVKVGGSSVTLSNNKYTISSITSDTTVEVEFEAITHTLTIKASGNGSASYDNTAIRSKTSTFTVNDGSSATISFTPDKGYRIKSVKVGGLSVTLSNNKYTISSITSDMTVEVEFEGITHTLTIKASGNGSASYDGTTIRGKTTDFTVNDGASATITFSPDDGFRIKSVKVGGSSVTLSNNKYTISSITSDTTVEVEFEGITHTLTIKASGNGSASYEGTIVRDMTADFTVNDGGSVTVSFSPDDGYRVKSVKVGGSSVTLTNNMYTISSIETDTTVEVEFEEIPVVTYVLSITSTGNGSASYDGTTIRNTTSNFEVNEGSSATISIRADERYRIKNVKMNNAAVVVAENQYTVANISGNVTVEVTFEAEEEPLTALSSGGVNYSVISLSDKTVMVSGGDYGRMLTVPATFEAEGMEWRVTGIEADALETSKELMAIDWQAETQFTATVENPNLLLYVKSEEYAPSTIQNVVIGRQAQSIVLTEAASGNGFYCPYEFTTQQISYTHSYGMTTGVGEARGWETIALPFDVQKISHSEKGEIVPFALWQRGEAKKPFWLMRLGENGFVEANGIRANLPYIISMPNHTDYLSDYILAGSVTFSAENVTVRNTDEAEPQQYGDRTFWPNFAVMDIGAGCLALNINNNLETNKSGMTEGSRFVLNSRAVHPFEAYMTTSASARSIGIFDDMTTAIADWPICKVQLDKDTPVFDLQGRKIAIPSNGQVKKGVYIKKGKKYIII